MQNQMSLEKMLEILASSCANIEHPVTIDEIYCLLASSLH
jgi:hypothetical protein